MLQGINVILYDQKEVGKDDFGTPIYEENPVVVRDVLIAPASDTDIISSTNLYGKKAVYTLAIPKGDTHDWEDREVEFFGKSWKTFGCGVCGIDALIPLRWNKKVMVETYE